MRLLWTPGAVRDLARLRKLLQPNSPEAAERAAARIRQAAAALIEQPEIGRMVGDALALRDLVASFGGGAYVLRYRIYSDAVVIARVWHSREDRD
ncbi:MAG TPA: type II toxin-antitoxin system RelE/ParE family toxin [Anaeromyxobacteraceae bacterium]|nr:type II toxin-antitoxin system RelE/ParE family toxin [Anaeromyxobacteraceae bacterium]